MKSTTYSNFFSKNFDLTEKCWFWRKNFVKTCYCVRVMDVRIKTLISQNFWKMLRANFRNFQNVDTKKEFLPKTSSRESIHLTWMTSNNTCGARRHAIFCWSVNIFVSLNWKNIFCLIWVCKVRKCINNPVELNLTFVTKTFSCFEKVTIFVQFL